MSVRLLVILTCISLIHAKVMELTCKQIRMFVDGHNSRRLRIAKGQVQGQPAAAEMNYLVWDPELAVKAAKWASRNQFEHNPNKEVPSQRFSTGENLYQYCHSDRNHVFDLDSSMNSWFVEHQHYTYNKLQDSDFNGPQQIGHYTQMVWADSTHVGCAISNHQTARNGMNCFFVVCNYGPSGNWLGEAPYRAGSASNNLKCGISSCEKLYGTC